jgi:sterol 3beta-glucosyltransferase
MVPQSDAGPVRASTGDEDIKKRVGRRLHKKRREERFSSMFPERLRDSDDSADEQETPTQGPPMFMNMNQSIFGLIAAAGSRVDFNDRFDGMSSDEEEGHETNQRETRPDDLAQTSVLKVASKGKGSRKRLSQHKLLRSLPTLPKLLSKSKRHSSRLSAPKEEDSEEMSEHSASGTSTPPTFTLTRHDSRQAPVMGRMLEAKAEMSSRPSFDVDRMSSDASGSSESPDLPPLAKKLMEIFEFDEPEQVIEGSWAPIIPRS